MVTIIDVEKVDFPRVESSTLFFVTVSTKEDLLKAAEFEGVSVIYRDQGRLYFIKGCLGVKYTP
ncbi:MAG: hypothetical protein RBG13Loki_0104 [Promethearchaeota archaeon CR_4]|nr:MAG: hypothetical protein RBG13Loki_0104 [Candidatus Lokiarchaeota archaeon CR_4]